MAHYRLLRQMHRELGYSQYHFGNLFNLVEPAMKPSFDKSIRLVAKLFGGLLKDFDRMATVVKSSGAKAE
jgi:hypothetical protein